MIYPYIHSEKKIEAIDGTSLAAARSDNVVRTLVQQVGTTRTPLPNNVFVSDVQRMLGLEDGDTCPGFTRYDEQYRQEHCADLFVKDAGDIPDSKEFTYYVPCPLAHPELCAAKEAGRLPMIKAIAKGLQNILRGAERGSYHCLRIFHTGGAQTATILFLSHRRYAHPRVFILTPCRYCPASLIVDFDDTGNTGDFEYLCDTTMLGRIILEPISTIDEVRISTVPLNKQICCQSFSQVLLQSDWSNICARSEQLVYPACAAAAAKPASSKQLIKGVAAVAQASGPKGAGAKRVKLVGPAGSGSDESVYANSASDYESSLAPTDSSAEEPDGEQHTHCFIIPIR